MKKFVYFLYSLVFVLAICCVGLTSCGGDDDDLGLPGSEEQGQGTGGSVSGKGKLDVVKVFSRVGAKPDEVRQYMSTNYSNYKLYDDNTSEWYSQGNIYTLISYSRNSTYIEYAFYKGVLLEGAVTYTWYDDDDFKELLSKLSDMYDLSIEKTGESITSGSRSVSYGGVRDKEDGIFAVYVSCFIASNQSQQSYMYYQVQSK